jgi:perosamine synthetase
MDRVMTLAKRYQLLVVEDCAEAIGSFYRGTHVGNWGDAAIFSFFGNKTLTTGEGGMVLFKDEAIRERARILRDHGMSPERRYWHDEVGYNYRITNLQAAVGVAQLERADFFVEKKRWIAEQYRKRLSLLSCLKLPQEYGDVTNSYWLYTVLLTEELALKRDQIIKSMKLNGIETRPVFYPMHRMPPYHAFAIDGAAYPVSNSISDTGISLPSGITLEISDITRVCDSFTKILVNLTAELRNIRTSKDFAIQSFEF